MKTPRNRTRSAPHVWKRFYQLKTGDTFAIGKFAYHKAGLFTGRVLATGDIQFVNPLLRVRTSKLVRKSLSGFSETNVKMMAPAQCCDGEPNTKSAEFKCCANGDCEPVDSESASRPATAAEVETVKSALAEFRGPVAQPNSCNAITGPTS